MVPLMGVEVTLLVAAVMFSGGSMNSIVKTHSHPQDFLQTEAEHHKRSGSCAIFHNRLCSCLVIVVCLIDVTLYVAVRRKLPSVLLC